MERAQNLHRLPPQVLWSTSEGKRRSPGDILDLCASYEDIKGHPAWEDHWGRIYGILNRLQMGLLQGIRGPNGEDISEPLRIAYGIVLEIVSVPGELDRRRRRAEEQQGLRQPPPGLGMDEELAL